jgi:hypothetical protein
MKIDLKKIINIKSKNELSKYKHNKPIFQSNYLFHYLIELGNLKALKLGSFPIYITNNDGLNGFHLACKYYNYDILEYLIKNYPDYIYNRTSDNKTFMSFVPFEEINKIIKNFKSLDWETLIEYGEDYQENNKLLDKIIINLNFNKLKEFIKLYPIKFNEQMFNIISNNNLTTDNIISILDEYSDDIINKKNSFGEGLLLISIKTNPKLIQYLLDRNIDIDYYSFFNTENPLRLAIKLDLLNNSGINMYNKSITKLLLDKIIKINPYFHKELDKNGNNILHTILYYILYKSNMMYIDSDISFQEKLLSFGDNDSWNQRNTKSLTPLDMLIELDYNIYNKIKFPKDFKINNITLKKLKDKSNNNLWYNFFKKFDIYEYDNIIIDNPNYSHSNLFQSKFIDIGIFIIYLEDKYKSSKLLEIPNCPIYNLNNLTFEDTIPFSDNIIKKEPIFPWIISFYSDTEYYINPYLNNIINGIKKENKTRITPVFLNLIYDNLFHANIIIYDFKNMTIERFEPYGNSSLVDYKVDDLLEEELTWNTGFKYIRPKDFLPVAGFQHLSNELDLANIKSGDFGGFCLGWCIWYLENRLKNINIDSKTLVKKLISKLLNMDIKIVDYIRNYSNMINEKRVFYLNKIGIKLNDISNINISNHHNNIITNYIINKFQGKNIKFP